MNEITDNGVEAYIAVLPDWQRLICREVRELVRGVERAVSHSPARSRSCSMRERAELGGGSSDRRALSLLFGL